MPDIDDLPKVKLNIRDYLGPKGGIKPYEQLAVDMEYHRKAGKMVTVVSVPGFLMCIGLPDEYDIKEYERPWYSALYSRYYKTASDCLNDVDGWTWEEEMCQSPLENEDG